MSEKTAETAAKPGPVGAGVVVGIALALMVAAALVAFLVISRGGPLDGAALLEESFGVRGVGPNFAITDARELPSGARIVIVEDAHAGVEPAASTDAPKSSEGPRTDWKKVAIPSADALPRRILFVFPKERVKATELDSSFETTEWKDVDDLDESGGKVVVASGKLPWRTFDARFVHERAFEPGGTFRDAVRANVSLAEHPCVMTATWTRGQSASKEKLAELLTALTPGASK